jgi:hypothetical protein
VAQPVDFLLLKHNASHRAVTSITARENKKGDPKAAFPLSDRRRAVFFNRAVFFQFSLGSMGSRAILMRSISGRDRPSKSFRIRSSTWAQA